MPFPRTCLFGVHSLGAPAKVLRDSFGLGHQRIWLGSKAGPPLFPPLRLTRAGPSRSSSSTSSSWWRKPGRAAAPAPWSSLPRSPSRTRSSGCFRTSVPHTRDLFSERTSRSRFKSLARAPRPAPASRLGVTMPVVII